MKKYFFLLLSGFFLIVSLNCSTARGDTYWRTYTIVGISGNNITLADKDGNQYLIQEDPKDYKAGYKVRYDSVRHILKKERWQEYKIKKISNETITLKHENGDILKVRNTYGGKFEEGDKVRFDTTSEDMMLSKEKP